MSSRLAVLLLVGNAAFAVVTLGQILQRSERSRFRYAIWQLHDRVVDAVRDGRLDADPEVVAFVKRLHLTIAATDLLTPFRVVASVRILRQSDWVPTPEPEPEHALLVEARSEADDARKRLFLRGSPSGWLLCALTPVVGLWVLMFDPEPRERKLMDAAIAWWRSRYGNSVDAVKRQVEARRLHTDCPDPAYA